MGGWISLLLWLAVAALLLGGWFYNMGQYREATKEVLVVVGSCAASMWLLARFNPGLWPPLAAGAVAEKNNCSTSPGKGTWLPPSKSTT